MPSPLSAWSGAPGSCPVLWPACPPVLSPWPRVALSSQPPHGLFFAFQPAAPEAEKQEGIWRRTKKKKKMQHQLYSVIHKLWSLNLAELFNFVLGNGGLLLQGCEKSLSLLCSWVRSGCRLEVRHIMLKKPISDVVPNANSVTCHSSRTPHSNTSFINPLLSARHPEH